ncbi:MAG: M23 family metallopeptidase [Bacteroidia bacterium]
MLLKRSLISKCLVFIAIICFNSAFTYANGVEKEAKTAKNTSDDPKKAENEFDSTFSTAWDYYINTWETDVLNPYEYDYSSFNQPVHICLAADSTEFVMPVVNVVTSSFGPRKGRQHQGVDIDLVTGDTVVSAFNGVVRMSRYYYGYGNMVVVRHHNGLETLYGHLSKVLVEPGQTVKAGEQIGLGGNTGHSRESHLHFEIRFMGQPIDPFKFIAFENFSLLNNEVMIDSSMFDNGKLIRKQKYAKNGSTGVKSSSKSGKKYHTVRQGDTLSAIARRYRTSVSKLCKLNHIRSTSILSLGKRLRVR